MSATKHTMSLSDHGTKVIHDTRTCSTCFLLAVPGAASAAFNRERATIEHRHGLDAALAELPESLKSNQAAFLDDDVNCAIVTLGVALNRIRAERGELLKLAVDARECLRDCCGMNKAEERAIGDADSYLSALIAKIEGAK